MLGAGTLYPSLAVAAAACEANVDCTAVYETSRGFQQRTCSPEHQHRGWCNLSISEPICNRDQGGTTYFLSRR